MVPLADKRAVQQRAYKAAGGAAERIVGPGKRRPDDCPLGHTDTAAAAAARRIKHGAARTMGKDG